VVFDLARNSRGQIDNVPHERCRPQVKLNREMRLILIGTDHRLQQTVVQDGDTKTWVPRNGGHRYRKLIDHCIKKIGARVILEETHADQERLAPTIGSTIAKERGLVWQSIGLDQPGLSDVVVDPPFVQTARPWVKPEILAGIYDLKKQKTREEFMYATIMDSMRKYESVLAIVGFVHLGVLARVFEVDQIPVDAFLFTYPLVVDETRS
jgi:hypothetical protein